VEVPNPELRIYAGISGFARLKNTKSNTTAVPSVAIIKKHEKAMIVCVEENRAKIREVQTGPLAENGEVEIIEGVAPGDMVMVYGHDAVEENDLVNVDWQQWTRRNRVDAVAK
jgi:hypothetical protein